MRSFFNWVMGFLLGSALGAALIILFAPMFGEDLKERLKQRYQEAMEAGHLASESKRVEMEAQLSKMRQDHGLNPKTD
jgi:gas vesicle protein